MFKFFQTFIGQIRKFSGQSQKRLLMEVQSQTKKYVQ